MSRQLGTGHIHSLSGAALACSALSGYVSPNLQSYRFVHAADVEKIKGQAGKTTGVICEDDTLEITLEIIPEGTTIANAKKSAGVPAAGTAFAVTGMPIIEAGGFTDALNTDGANTQPWIYEGGASWNGLAAGKQTMSLPLKRYLQITSGTAVT